MNSFLFKPFLFYFILISQVLSAQSGNHLTNPIHPLGFLAEPIIPESSVSVSYSNPLGIKSLREFQCRYKYSNKRSIIHAAIHNFGIKGYAQYRVELGYAISINSSCITGLSLHSDFLHSGSLGPIKFYPGSSLYSSFKDSDFLRFDIYLNNWTSLWFSDYIWSGKPGISLLVFIKGNEKINVISGLNYSRGFTPIFRAGVAILASHNHSVVAGLQSGPAGFWVGYSMNLNKLRIIIAMQSGGVFGYEPSSSIKYFIN